MKIAFAVVLAAGPSFHTVAGDSNGSLMLQDFLVLGERVANERPATGVSTPVTPLRFDPRVDVQARGPAERQADITVRGGIFENTGFSLHGLPLLDPQTGHYVGEVPLDPRMLSGPVILTGLDNAFEGFNSTVATVRYDLARIESGGEIEAGVGQYGLHYQRAYAGARPERAGAGAVVAADVGYARAKSRGTIERGDFDYERVSGRVQIESRLGRTDVFAGYADEFYGWPGMYIGRAFGVLFPETDHIRVSLAGARHEKAYGEGSHVGAGIVWRRLQDEYQFNRDTPSPMFTHETRMTAAVISGRHDFGGGGVDYRLAGMADRLVFSRALRFGEFDSRRTLRLSAVPFLRREVNDGGEWVLRAGAAFDASDREANVLLPLFGVRRSGASVFGDWSLYAEAAASSQVPGYTTLNSNPTGLFGGHAGLGREKARNIEAGGHIERERWQVRTALFRREDRALVDWVFAAGTPNVRRAAPVDIDTTGLEAVAAVTTGALHWVAGYVYLHKSADYGAADVDASYYALNVPEHRLTLAAIARLHERVRLRVDSEVREQAGNVLRGSGDHAFRMSASLAWEIPAALPVELGVVGDNLTDSQFENFPGTPADRRQFSAYVRMNW